MTLKKDNHQSIIDFLGSKIVSFFGVFSHPTTGGKGGKSQKVTNQGRQTCWRSAFGHFLDSQVRKNENNFAPTFPWA